MTSYTQLHDLSLSWLGTNTSMKGGGELLWKYENDKWQLRKTLISFVKEEIKSNNTTLLGVKFVSSMQKHVSLNIIIYLYLEFVNFISTFAAYKIKF